MKPLAPQPQRRSNRRMAIAIALLVAAWVVLMVFRTPIRIHWWAWRLAHVAEPSKRLYYTARLAAHAARSVGPVAALLQHPDASVRLAAVAILNQARDRRAEPYLLAAIRDRDADVREMAALGLARFKRDEAVAVLEPLLDDADELTACAAIVGLQRVGSPRACKAVARKLAQTSSLPLRVQAIESAGLMRAVQAVPALIDLLADETPVADPPAGERAVRRFLARQTRKLGSLPLPGHVAGPAYEPQTVADYAARALRAITGQS
ncbi:MAG: HEAT repeat domain-containing protein, partial [Phycisphaerae bacterium]